MATEVTNGLGRAAVLTGVFGGLLALLAASVADRPAAAQEKGKPYPMPPADAKPEWVGASLCQNCHDREDPKKIVEYQQTRGYDFIRLWENKVWSVHDLHSQAYANLLTKDSAKGEKDAVPNPTAQKMEDNLRRAYGKMDYSVAADKNCLACHASLKSPVEVTPPDKWTADSFVALKEEGVGCEMCHGHGSLYRDEHQKNRLDKTNAPEGAIRVVDWRTMPPEVKTKWGLVNLRDPAVAAHRCASCHVGNKDEGRFVTHDMFAAGHPPLPPLDLLAYTREQPRHWGLASEMPYLTALSKKDADKAWAVFHLRDGESFVARRLVESSVASVAATLGLAGQLAGHAKGAADGLDYAAFDCYACHHDLKYPSDRQSRGYEGIPGRPYFRQAPFALARVVLDHASGMKDGGALKDQLTALEALQKKLADAFAKKTYGDPDAIAAVGKEAAAWSTATLAALQKVRYERADTEKLLAKVVEAAAREPVPAGQPTPPPGKRPVADPEVAQLYTWAFETLVLDLGPAPKDPTKPPPPPPLVTELTGQLKGHVVTRLRPGAAFYYEQAATGGVPAPTLESVDKRLTDRMNTFNSFRGDLFRDAFKKAEPGIKAIK